MDYLKGALDSFIAMELKATLRSMEIWDKIQRKHRAYQIIKRVSGRDFSKKTTIKFRRPVKFEVEK